MKYLIIMALSIFPLTAQLVVDLETALNLAYENNQKLLALKELIEEAKAGKTISLSAFYPQVSAFTDGYYNLTYQNVTDSHNTFGSAINLSQSILEVASYYDVKISDLNIKKVQFLYDSLKNDITYDVKRSYYKIVHDLEKVAAHQENVDLLFALNKRMKDRLKIGEAIALNVNQSQVSLASSKTRYYQALKVLKDDLNGFSVLLGFNPEEVHIEIKDSVFQYQYYPYLFSLYEKAKSNQEITRLITQKDVSDFEEKILRHNPIIKTQNMALKMMNESVKRSFSDYYPTVKVYMHYGATPNPYAFYPSSHISNEVFQLGVGLGLHWNLFDGFKREGNIKKTQHRRQSTFYDLESITQKIAYEFTESITGIETSMAQVLSSEENVSLAELTREQAYDQLEIGYYTIYDYQIALDQLVQVKDLLSQSKYELFKSYFELEKVIGKPLEGDLSHGQ